VRISDILLACITDWPGKRPGTPTAVRLRSLAEHLIEFGELGHEDFHEAVRTLMWQVASRRIARLESLLARHAGEPAYWAADIRWRIEAICQALTDPAYVIPCDLPAGGDTLSRTQQLMRQFGELLLWWPAILEKAAALSAKGIELGQQVN
jgi:hypothetical protein